MDVAVKVERSKPQCMTELVWQVSSGHGLVVRPGATPTQRHRWRGVSLHEPTQINATDVDLPRGTLVEILWLVVELNDRPIAEWKRDADGHDQCRCIGRGQVHAIRRLYTTDRTFGHREIVAPPLGQAHDTPFALRLGGLHPLYDIDAVALAGIQIYRE